MSSVNYTCKTQIDVFPLQFSTSFYSQEKWSSWINLIGGQGFINWGKLPPKHSIIPPPPKVTSSYYNNIDCSRIFRSSVCTLFLAAISGCGQ